MAGALGDTVCSQHLSRFAHNLLANFDEQQRDVASKSYLYVLLPPLFLPIVSIYLISNFSFLLSLPPCFRHSQALRKKPKPEIQKGPPRIQHNFVDRQICEYLVSIALKLQNYPKKDLPSLRVPQPSNVSRKIIIFYLFILSICA